jgi:hypothetical protein
MQPGDMIALAQEPEHVSRAARSGMAYLRFANDDNTIQACHDRKGGGYTHSEAHVFFGLENCSSKLSCKQVNTW